MSKPWPCARDATSRSTTSCGQRLAGLVVDGVAGEHLGPPGPHLVDLGGELHEVARHRGAVQPRVARRRRTARAARGRTRGRRCGPRRWSSAPGWPGGGFGHVEADHHDRPACRAGATGRRTPSIQAPPRLVGRANQSQTNSPSGRPVGVAVEDLEDPHVLGVAGRSSRSRERDAVQPGGGEEDPVVEHPLRARSTAHGVGVDVVGRGQVARGVVRPVPRLAPVPRRRRRASAPRCGPAPPRGCAIAGPAISSSMPSTAFEVPAVWSATTYAAWSANPSSAARSARSAVISPTSSRVSCSPPRMPRVVAASCSRRRTSRSVSEEIAGWMVGSTSGQQVARPGPRSAAASAADSTTLSASPSSSARSVTCTAQSVGLGEHPVAELRGERGEPGVQRRAAGRRLVVGRAPHRPGRSPGGSARRPGPARRSSPASAVRRGRRRRRANSRGSSRISS